MADLIPCVHGGNEDCKRYGGSGVVLHTAGYVHPIARVTEVLLAKSVTESPLVEEETEFYLHGLEEAYDDEIAKAYLGLDVPTDISKSIYYFDLKTEEGVDRLIELLPILDSEVLKEVYAEIFPNYPVNEPDRWNERIARLEVKGYLLGHKKFGALGQNNTADADE